MVGHGGSSAGLYLADPTSPIPSHCASIVATSTLTVKGSPKISHSLAIDPCWVVRLEVVSVCWCIYSSHCVTRLPPSKKMKMEMKANWLGAWLWVKCYVRTVVSGHTVSWKISYSFLQQILISDTRPKCNRQSAWLLRAATFDVNTRGSVVYMSNST